MVITQSEIEGDDSKTPVTGDPDCCSLLLRSTSALNRIQNPNYAVSSCREGDPLPVFPMGQTGADQWVSEKAGLRANLDFRPQATLPFCPSYPNTQQKKLEKSMTRASGSQQWMVASCWMTPPTPTPTPTPPCLTHTVGYCEQ